MTIRDHLSQAFRGALERYVTEIYIPFVKTCKPETRIKNILKYEHDYDFWLGYVIGQLEGHTLQLFKSEYGHDPTDEDRFEIEEIIQINQNKIIEILKKNFDKN